MLPRSSLRPLKVSVHVPVKGVDSQPIHSSELDPTRSPPERSIVTEASCSTDTMAPSEMSTLRAE